VDKVSRAEDEVSRAEDKVPRAEDEVPRAEDEVPGGKDNVSRAEDKVSRRALIYRPIAKLSDRALNCTKTRLIMQKQIILLYFYVAKNEFQCLRRVFMVISSFFFNISVLTM
jgi:hypothetical protein